ncbi:MAG: YidC/Oxa1 family membrane protein insertase [Candidatus Sericytochromatia bacterium]
MNPIDFLVDKMMLPIVETCYSITGNYGWAIVLLTVIIKMVLMPLTVQSYYSMKAMQKIQPKLKKIQERYRSKPEELNKQMMMLYRENKVNPLGGCLPMLIQMPFLIALYASLIGPQFKKMLESSGHKSFLFMDDLAKIGVMQGSTPYFDNLFMVAMFGITTWYQQRIMTPPTVSDDPQQAAMQRSMAAMPVIITAMFLFFPVPSGVFVYLVISNVITIAQYGFLNAQSASREAKLVAAGGAPVAALDKAEEEDVESEDSGEALSAVAGNGNKYKVKKSAKKKKRK